jgi:NCAIR mutase (PurE)-related protein
VTRERLEELLRRVRDGAVSPADAAEELRRLPFEVLPEAMVDHHRALRAGIPEVVFGEHKSAAQIATIMAALAAGGAGALATRVDAAKAAAVLAALPGARHEAMARAVILDPSVPLPVRRTVAVVAAGTSDLPVAEEAAVSAAFFGLAVDRITDVGIAGLHRLLAQVERLRAADVVIAVAGMEGALPSAVAGLVDRPVIAVPTSIGYGVSLGGFAAMIGMLSSCAPGVTVVNIDNGFGAAVAAALISRVGRLRGDAAGEDGDR